MRRLFAIAIAILIGLPTVSPLFALGGGTDPNLPACCRRDGKHHCMLVDMEAAVASSSRSSSGRVHLTTVTERCPYGARTAPASIHPDWTLRTSSAVFADVVAHPSVAPQTESKRRVSADRSRQKRGPPASQLS